MGVSARAMEGPHFQKFVLNIKFLSLFLFLMCVTFNLDALYNMLLLGDGNVCELEVAIVAVACEKSVIYFHVPLPRSEKRSLSPFVFHC